jgi:glyoxylase-like metal-dependent hydrolase (beta-lactamase superfamily II)
MKTARPALLTLALTAGCAASTHPVARADLGVVRRTADLLAVIDQPGPIVVESVASADWVVPLDGLLNLEHPKAVAAGLEDREEPIKIYFHALRHPTRGTFVVDTGVERALRDSPDDSIIGGLVASAMNLESLKIHVPLGVWLEHNPIAGVLLTHLHLDHIMGLPDVPRGTPIYAGPGETTPTAFQNMFTQGTTDDAFEGHGALREWPFAPDADQRFEGVIDVLGDGSLWALWAPGHTPGSTAYLARTPSGPVLLVGDACHTAWGWDHDVEPGSYSGDVPRSRTSLDHLQRLVAEHPSIDVRVGHQAHGGAGS